MKIKAGLLDLLSRFAVDALSGVGIILLYTLPAILINICLKFYKKSAFYDPLIYYPAYALEIFTIVTGFLLAVKLLTILFIGLWRELTL